MTRAEIIWKTLPITTSSMLYRKLLNKLLNKQCYIPLVIAIARLKSYSAAQKKIFINGAHG
ncbi:hypothetical protein [Chroococcidiopsis sp.]|uniref:hypothetical protein n=1 Tax=Chroococcidiopsis sp. TaxID=3088168 RepID=UPI003F3FD84E